jgi:hypothetical protein
MTYGILVFFQEKQEEKVETADEKRVLQSNQSNSLKVTVIFLANSSYTI